MGGGASKTDPAVKAADQLFKEFDANKDGKLSLDELTRAAKQHGATVAKAWPKKLIEKTLAQYDANGDGYLDKAEWKAVLLALVRTPGKKEWDAIAACDDGDAAALESLLKAGAAPNAADDDGWTPLLSALLEGHTECAKLLLASPSIDVNQAQNDGATPLHMAAQNGLAECVTLLRLAVHRRQPGEERRLHAAVHGRAGRPRRVRDAVPRHAVHRRQPGAERRRYHRCTSPRRRATPSA